jgi:hypothetical protein
VKGKNISNASSNTVTWDHIKLFRRYLNNIAGKHEIRVVQKIDILGTTRILRKVLM